MSTERGTDIAAKSKPAEPVKKRKGWQGPGPGRKRLGSKHVMLTLDRMFAEEVAAWITGQPDKPSWPKAVRRLMRLGLDRGKRRKT